MPAPKKRPLGQVLCACPAPQEDAFGPGAARRQKTERPPQSYVWLQPPPAVRAALDAHRRQWWWPRGSHLPAAQRLHLTLHALGSLEPQRVEVVARALSRLRQPAFELELDWCGVWPGSGVAVACPRPGAALAHLHGALAQALPAAPGGRGGADAAADWQPHVTLAWQAWGAGAPPMPPLRWPVREFLFVRSWLPPHAARHELLGRYALV